MFRLCPWIKCFKTPCMQAVVVPTGRGEGGASLVGVFCFRSFGV